MSQEYALNTVCDTYSAIYLTIEKVRITEGLSDYKFGADCNGLFFISLRSYSF